MSLNPNWCTLCRQSGEDMDHLLIHCNVANNIWIKLQNPIEYHTMVKSTYKNFARIFVA